MSKGRPHMSRLRPAAFLLAGAALCAMMPALAQAPPSRGDRDRERERPNYVDSADYDRQPYYVDGVEYKPYVPEKKPARPTAKPAAETVKSPPQSSGTPSDPAYVSPAPQTELRPFNPSAAGPQAAPAAPRQQAQTSSSSASAVPSYARAKRPRFGVAIIEALDKISSESVRFEAPIGQPVRYKGLIYTVKACETSADDEPMSDVIAYMQVRTNPVTAANNTQTTRSKEIFRGWTYASTPSLNPLEHPIYDAWVIACRKPLAAPAVAVVAPAPTKPAAAPKL